MEQQTKPSVGKGNYAFIDGQNLNMGIKKLGWNLDFRKFHYYLQRKYGVTKAYFFIGMVEEQADLYSNLLSMGYTSRRSSTKRARSREILTLTWYCTL